MVTAAITLPASGLDGTNSLLSLWSGTVALPASLVTGNIVSMFFRRSSVFDNAGTAGFDTSAMLPEVNTVRLQSTQMVGTGVGDVTLDTVCLVTRGTTTNENGLYVNRLTVDSSALFAPRTAFGGGWAQTITNVAERLNLGIGAAYGPITMTFDFTTEVDRLKIGAANPTAIYLGSTEIKTAYRGDVEVYKRI